TGRLSHRDADLPARAAGVAHRPVLGERARRARALRRSVVPVPTNAVVRAGRDCDEPFRAPVHPRVEGLVRLEHVRMSIDGAERDLVTCKAHGNARLAAQRSTFAIARAGILVAMCRAVWV